MRQQTLPHVQGRGCGGLHIRSSEGTTKMRERERQSVMGTRADNTAVQTNTTIAAITHTQAGTVSAFTSRFPQQRSFTHITVYQYQARMKLRPNFANSMTIEIIFNTYTQTR